MILRNSCVNSSVYQTIRLAPGLTTGSFCNYISAEKKLKLFGLPL